MKKGRTEQSTESKPKSTSDNSGGGNSGFGKHVYARECLVDTGKVCAWFGEEEWKEGRQFIYLAARRRMCRRVGESAVTARLCCPIRNRKTVDVVGTSWCGLVSED